MNSDSSPLNFQKGEYSYALNASIEDFSGENINIQNTGSNLLQTNFPEDYFVIGKVHIYELNRTLFMLTNLDGLSKIGEVVDEQYDDDSDDKEGVNKCCDCPDGYGLDEPKPLELTTQLEYQPYHNIINSNCLGFDINNPVDIEYKVTSTGVNIYFTDNLNTLRFLYFDLVGNQLVLQNRFKTIIGYDFENCDIPQYSEVLDCNKIKFNPDYSRPCIDAYDISNGGQLREGAYQALVAYSDVNGIPLTKYFSATPNISIKSLDIKVETNNLTDKSISFKINNLEQSNVYSYYNIVIAETVDNFTSFKLAATLPITQSSFTYTGTNILKDLTSNDIFFERPIYKTSTSLTKANDYLFAARLKEHTKLNLQQAVNRIPLYWQTKAVTEEVYKDEIASGEFRTYMRDEVYAAALVFEMVDDNDTIAFPLVAPSKQYFSNVYNIDVDKIISNDDVIVDTGCVTTNLNKNWQCYNLAKVIGTPHQPSTICGDNNCWEWGDFAYWESTDLYPNIPEIWGDLCGQPIRHFKFPDSLVTHIHDSEYGTKNFEENNLIYPIGFKLEHGDVVAALQWAVDYELITAEQKSRIKGYRLVRSNRVGHKSITAKGLLYDMWNYQRDGQTYHYANYPYNDLNPDKFIAPDNTTYDGSNTSDPTPSTFTKTNRYTFHSPDVHFTNSTLGNILKLETVEYGKSEGFFNHCEEQSRYRLLSTVARTLCFATGVAAALSSVTKQCRVIKSIGTQTEVGSSFIEVSTGVFTAGSGSIVPIVTPIVTGNVVTDNPSIPPVFTYNHIVSPSPDLTAAYTETNDCKGTTFHFLSPLHLAALAPSNTTAALIMGSVLAVAGGISEALYLFTIMIREMDLLAKTILALTPKNNLAIQYNSIGKYNNYEPQLNNGNKQRYLSDREYLFGSHLITQDNSKINNWHRESSVYLKTVGTSLSNPSVVDNSRVTMDDAGLGYNDLNKITNRNISSYYSSLKNYVPNQYGTIYNIEYLETSGCSTQLNATSNSCRTYYGGDTFITRFALKRKLPFFLQTRFRQLDEADVSYSDLGNVGYPNYYFDANEGYMQKLSTISLGDIFGNTGAFLQDLVGTDDTRMDAKTAKFFYQNGYIHLYNYGIPYFLVESDVNTYFRHAEGNNEKDFYPHQKDLSYWLQEKNVPISEDNTYYYNRSYSKQNKESFVKRYTPTYLKETLDINNIFDQRVIYTDKSNYLEQADNWLIFRANNFYDVPRASGKVISVDGIEQDKVLLRAENNTQIFNAYDTIKTSATTLQVSTGGIFQSRPQQFAMTDLGYMATQHRAILQTEFGHVWCDAKRGNVFILGNNASGIEEISKNGMRNWFKENLPFQIVKDFPTISLDDMDNSFKGIGICMSFDKRYSRLHLTKLDYKRLKPTTSYDKFSKKFYDNGNEVFIYDTNYFCNKSWTISYNFLTKTWVSFHSFLPNYYNDQIDSFSTGINDFEGNHSDLWGHNLTNKSYQVYYNKLYPYIIDVMAEPTASNMFLNSIEYLNDVIRYHNKFDSFYKNNITFNKAIVYNDRQNSGLLELQVQNPEDLKQFDIYPKVLQDRIQIEVSNSEYFWKFNDFFDASSCQTNNVPLWIRGCSNSTKDLNLKAFNYLKSNLNQARLRGQFFNVRFINDKYSPFKYIFNLSIFNKNNSVR